MYRRQAAPWSREMSAISTASKLARALSCASYGGSMPASSLHNGAPTPHVSATLGHADLKTTSVYAHARPGESSRRCPRLDMRKEEKIKEVRAFWQRGSPRW